MIKLRETNPLLLAVAWLSEQMGNTDITQEDIVEHCRLGEIRLLAAVPGWNDGGDGEIGWMERVEKADSRAKMTGAVLSDGSVFIGESNLVPAGKFISGDGLIVVTPEMAYRLLVHGKSSLSCARMTVFQCGPDGTTALDEPLVGVHDGRMINFTHLRVKKSALEAFAATVVPIELASDGLPIEADANFETQEQNELSPKENCAAFDITTTRGSIRRILEVWDKVESRYGSKADARQVLRVLNEDKGEKQPALKTVQNHLISLRKKKLIP